MTRTPTCSVPGCIPKSPQIRRGLCVKHFYRLEKYGSFELPPKPQFWDFVDKTETCWLWTGRRHMHGYGRWGTKYAHRLAYEEATTQPLPRGIHLDHLCHTPPCVRPDHLQPTTPSENLQNRAGPPSNNTSGYRGVSYVKRVGRWRAYATVNRRQYSGGLYATAEEADVAARELRNRIMSNNLLDRMEDAA